MNTASQTLLKSLGLTDDQLNAAAERGRNVIVTAGAGSGKTRTLVARYLALLAEGLHPRRVTAITFTEKAAREMRSRVRSALTQQIARAADPAERQRWSLLDAQMDSARIGTIHSLCAEILRAHPAEAGIDPRFNVLEDGLAATLRAQAVSDTLTWLVSEPELKPLLTTLSAYGLQTLLANLLARRLEAEAAFGGSPSPLARLQAALERLLAKEAFTRPLAALRALQSSGGLLADAGDKLAEQIEQMLVEWNAAELALGSGSVLNAAQRLFNARRLMGLKAGKQGMAKGALKNLQSAYDDHLNPLLDGAKGSDLPPDETIETLFAQALPLVGRAFAHLLETYQAALRLRQALDFDDLEAGAARLLTLPELCTHWQAEVDAVLVDEFQDTNARQNAIVLALCGQTPGRLFVVGDPRQSIYRFRQADVTVFKTMTQTARSEQDRTLVLDLTYRSHEPLLAAMGGLLAAVMGEQDDPERPYYVPYAALKSNHSAARPGILAPHIEFVLGGGEDAETARPEAARALAQRLLELRQAGQVEHWDDVTLLFRAASGFPAYEQAFEEAGIPFVTVAGKGFYDRPEIRDVLNLLRTLADPWDDLAMAGALRSPAFGLSDAALYQLRRASGARLPYWSALQGSLENLSPVDQVQARRARQIFAELQPLADRLPVAELLKRLVDRVDYRAILASVETGSRLWRNLDKLLADAQVSELVNVRAFLEYLETLKDVGAREGEAPTEAEGAVRLMTIHKAKGLEFPLVVLADASRQRPKGTSPVYLLAGEGQNPPAAAFKLDLLERPPLLMRLAQLEDNLQSEAEELRLLYVALTRAKEKLLISGHCKTDRAGSWKADGWLQTLAAPAQLDLSMAFETGQPQEIELSGMPLRVWARTAAGRPATGPASADHSGWEAAETVSLVGPLALPALPEPQAPDHRQDSQPNWQAVRSSLAPPAEALGKMVHRAIQRWRFPGQPGLADLLSAAGREAGIAAPAQLAEAIRQAELLLGRLQQHPLWLEINQAPARFHEVPFSYAKEDKKLDSGYFDLLYRSPTGWEIVDFKTDSIASPAERSRAVENHQAQMLRYTAAAARLLKEPVRVRLCFLDDESGVSLE